MPRQPTMQDWIFLRNVNEPAYQGTAGWRADMPLSVYNNPLATGARFFLWHGPVVTIPMQEMRRVLPNPPQIRPDGTTLTPFNIDPIGRTVNRAPVAMTLGEEANRIVEPIRKGWTGGESERHRNTVGAIAANPGLAGIPVNDPVVRTWHDRVLSNDGRFLWLRLRSRKHPDVVFEHASGAITVVEVEPHDTILDGLGQLGGDYLVNLRVDRRAANPDRQIAIRGILVCDRDMPAGWDDILAAHDIRFHRM
jgi:hypothetical protein